ncbi:MAG: hypothetical protein EP329_20165 [Deltaproteobacteria bacterium]|nr:MAG: hypothetical protein EP329_20165 [Deltaproteobacteria bacterium]
MSSRIRRGILGLATVALIPSAPACDTPITVSNAVPRVTWVAVEPVDATTARITVWISDVEGDSVDLAVGWVGSDGVETALVEQPGGYGTVGLPTREALFDDNGQPHAILWDTTDVSGTVRLRMTPDDRPHEDGKGVGATVETPAFDLTTGIPEPVRAE